MKKWRVVVADDHAVVREGIKMLLNAQPDMEVVGEAADGEDAWRQVKTLAPDVVIMDVWMPELNGAQATERVKEVCPEAKVLALSGYSDEKQVQEILAAGAVGYVLKTAVCQQLVAAVRAVLMGGVHLDPAVAAAVVAGSIPPRGRNQEARLSPRERDVLRLLAWGHTHKAIAQAMHLSIKTVESYQERAKSRLGFESRADIVRYAVGQGWLQAERPGSPKAT